MKLTGLIINVTEHHK